LKIVKDDTKNHFLFFFFLFFFLPVASGSTFSSAGTASVDSD